MDRRRRRGFIGLVVVAVVALVAGEAMAEGLVEMAETMTDAELEAYQRMNDVQREDFISARVTALKEMTDEEREAWVELRRAAENARRERAEAAELARRRERGELPEQMLPADSWVMSFRDRTMFCRGDVPSSVKREHFSAVLRDDGTIWPYDEGEWSWKGTGPWNGTLTVIVRHDSWDRERDQGYWATEIHTIEITGDESQRDRAVGYVDSYRATFRNFGNEGRDDICTVAAQWWGGFRCWCPDWETCERTCWEANLPAPPPRKT